MCTNIILNLGDWCEVKRRQSNVIGMERLDYLRAPLGRKGLRFMKPIKRSGGSLHLSSIPA